MAPLIVLFGGLGRDRPVHPLTWQAIVVTVAIVFVIRPVAGLVALFGFEWKWIDRLAISFLTFEGSPYSTSYTG